MIILRITSLAISGLAENELTYRAYQRLKLWVDSLNEGSCEGLEWICAGSPDEARAAARLLIAANINDSLRSLGVQPWHILYTENYSELKGSLFWPPSSRSGGRVYNIVGEKPKEG